MSMTTNIIIDCINKEEISKDDMFTVMKRTQMNFIRLGMINIKDEVYGIFINGETICEKEFFCTDEDRDSTYRRKVLLELLLSINSHNQWNSRKLTILTDLDKSDSNINKMKENLGIDDVVFSDEFFHKGFYCNSEPNREFAIQEIITHLEEFKKRKKFDVYFLSSESSFAKELGEKILKGSISHSEFRSWLRFI